MTPGTRIGPYEVIAPLGEGGMGEVYRAKDTALGREVAVKILPAAVAGDPERLARFDREAKALAALSHANIAQIYGLERGCIVMELAPGDDLSVRIKQGPIPFDESLPIAAQIASALEAAHERSIVHRDLKPANVRVSHDGAVKVLDFGLAKAMAPDSSGDSIEVMNSPTFTAQATAAGVILGTAAYMSPEQARGRVADKRSDIWAFGVVLYEMLTGKRLFEGDTISDTIAAVLRQEIPFAALPAGTPREIDKLLRRCLERDRRNRLHDIADARIVIEEVMRGGAAETVATPAASRRPMMMVAAVAVAFLAIGLLGGWLAGRPAPSPASPVVRFSLKMPKGIQYPGEPAVAPDGSFLVFGAISGTDQPQLFIQRLGEGVPRPIAKTENGFSPIVSPDGRWILFRRSGRFEKISIDGGDPLVILEGDSSIAGTTWVPGGPIVFAPTWLGPLKAVSPDGGAVRTISTVDATREENSHLMPTALPDGHHVLITIGKKNASVNDADTAILDLDTGVHRVLFKGFEASYVDPGFIVFYRAGGYHAVRFDPRTLTTLGDPVRVLDDAYGNSALGDRRNLSVTPGGVLAYLSGPYQMPRPLTFVSEGGTVEPLPFPVRPYASAAVSPDQSRVAAGSIENGRNVIRLLDLERRTDELLDWPGDNWDGVWHPDGRHLWFNTLRSGTFDVYQHDMGNSSPSQPVLASDQDEEIFGFTPDGRSALVRVSTPDGLYTFRLMPLASPQSLPAVSPTAVNHGAISRDGRLLAYVSSRSSSGEVYVKDLSGEAAPQKIGAGNNVAWSADGRDLLILREPEIVAVRFTVDNGRFRALAERRWSRVEGDYSYSIFAPTKDGRVLVAFAKEPIVREIRVVLNWAQEIAGKFAR